MLRIIAWVLLFPGAIAFLIAVIMAYNEPSALTIGVAISIFVAAFLTPTLLFALADLVQYTRETRDAVRSLAAVGSPYTSTRAHRSEPGSGGIERGTHEAAAIEAGRQARARFDASGPQRGPRST